MPPPDISVRVPTPPPIYQETDLEHTVDPTRIPLPEEVSPLAFSTGRDELPSPPYSASASASPYSASPTTPDSRPVPGPPPPLPPRTRTLSRHSFHSPTAGPSSPSPPVPPLPSPPLSLPETYIFAPQTPFTTHLLPSSSSSTNPHPLYTITVFPDHLQPTVHTTTLHRSTTPSPPPPGPAIAFFRTGLRAAPADLVAKGTRTAALAGVLTPRLVHAPLGPRVRVVYHWTFAGAALAWDVTDPFTKTCTLARAPTTPRADWDAPLATLTVPDGTRLDLAHGCILPPVTLTVTPRGRGPLLDDVVLSALVVSRERIDIEAKETLEAHLAQEQAEREEAERAGGLLGAISARRRKSVSPVLAGGVQRSPAGGGSGLYG